jgi:hypothetical protein
MSGAASNGIAAVQFGNLPQGPPVWPRWRPQSKRAGATSPLSPSRNLDTVLAACATLPTLLCWARSRHEQPRRDFPDPKRTVACKPPCRSVAPPKYPRRAGSRLLTAVSKQAPSASLPRPFPAVDARSELTASLQFYLPQLYRPTGPELPSL